MHSAFSSQYDWHLDMEHEFLPKHKRSMRSLFLQVFGPKFMSSYSYANTGDSVVVVGTCVVGKLVVGACVVGEAVVGLSVVGLSVVGVLGGKVETAGVGGKVVVATSAGHQAPEQAKQFCSLWTHHPWS